MFLSKRYSAKIIKIGSRFSCYDDVLKQAANKLPSASSCVKLFRDIEQDAQVDKSISGQLEIYYLPQGVDNCKSTSIQ